MTPDMTPGAHAAEAQASEWQARHGATSRRSAYWMIDARNVDHTEALTIEADRRKRSGAAPADVNDDAAWRAYLAETTDEPTDAERAATLIAVTNPYAEARARAVEGFKRTARMLWRHRRAEGWRHNDTVSRETLHIYASVVRTYDRMARTWAAGQLAAQRDGVDAVTVR